jgi:hypothetical protein
MLELGQECQVLGSIRGIHYSFSPSAVRRYQSLHRLNSSNRRMMSCLLTKDYSRESLGFQDLRLFPLSQVPPFLTWRNVHRQDRVPAIS